MNEIIRKYFLVKEIKSKSGELHFRRWKLLTTPWFNLYIHGIYKSDEEAHLHDHPWDYWSICFKGRFIEKRKTGHSYVPKFKLIKRKAKEFHCIYQLLTKTAYTLFFTFKKKKDWGYDVNGVWVDHITYRRLKNAGKL